MFCFDKLNLLKEMKTFENLKNKSNEQIKKEN